MSETTRWTIALVLAGGVALVATPLAARWGARARRRGRRGGLGSAAGLGAGLLAVTPLLADADAPLAVAVVAAAWLFAFGTMVDRGLIPARLRPLGLLAASGVVAAAGLRLRVTGFDVGDALVTVGVVYAATTAWRSAQPRDGLLAGWAIAIGLAASAMGGLAGQSAVAALGAGLTGACVGFLAYWLPPTAARLRTGGSMLIGFVAVALALDAQPVLGRPRDGAIVLLLLALPLLDGLVVAGTWVRRRHVDPSAASLPGRLRALGIPRAVVTLVLVFLQAALCGLALLAGRGVLSWALAMAIGAAVVVIVLLLALPARLEGPPGRWRARTVLVGAGLVGVVIVLSAPAGVALLRARDAALRAADEARAGLAAARDGDSEAAARAFARAQAEFNDAERTLSDPFVSGGLVVPVLAPNLRAARDLVAIGRDVASAGQRLTSSADPQQLTIRDGTVPIAELAQLEPELAATADTLQDASERLRSVDRAFLVASVDDAIGDLSKRLRRATRETRIAAEAARVLPAVFGSEGPRRYFLAVQNNSEARATGGFIGSWGIINAHDGVLSLEGPERITVLNPQTPEAMAARVLHAPADYRERYARFNPERVWQNVNMSPDLPTVGAVTADVLIQAGVGEVDGVVTVDPLGLAAVLRLTGPVTVPDWPVPITADNVADVILREEYVVFDQDRERRDEFLGDVADAAWRAFTEGDLGSPARVLRELGRATHEKHLSVWLVDDEAQRLLRHANSDGAVPVGRGDLSLVTTQNASASKIDAYLQRSLRYVVELQPVGSGGEVTVESRLEITLENTAPASGLPDYVIGSTIPNLGRGVNRTFLTVYSPFDFQAATLDGTATGLETKTEFRYLANATFLDVAPSGSSTLVIDREGQLKLGRDGRYRLHLVRQPLEAPDDVEVVIKVPHGWRLVDGKGLEIDRSGRRARFVGALERDQTVAVRVEWAPTSLLDRLRAGT